MKFSRSAAISVALLAAASVGNVTAFTPPFATPLSTTTTTTSTATAAAAAPFMLHLSSSSSETTNTAVNNDNSSDDDDPLGLTPELRRLTDAFANIGDDKLRYKQLLYMASNGLDPMPDHLKTDENKVLGCLSTVHVHATVRHENNQDLVYFTGDSDGLLTKGLVALLVRGLSGTTAEALQKVDPKFIQTAGIAQSLTPGRNNGFLNMLALMKQKALQAGSAEAATPAEEESSDNNNNNNTESSDSDRPMYNAIVKTLQKLQPTRLELIDNSHQHAGHAGNTGNGSESHFQLTIVADAFDGLNLVKRHQLIYMMLGDVMPKIHALQIQALTPQEAGDK